MREPHEPTIAPLIPRKLERQGSFAATNTTRRKQSLPTLNSTPKDLARLVALSRSSKDVFGSSSRYSPGSSSFGVHRTIDVKQRKPSRIREKSGPDEPEGSGRKSIPTNSRSLLLGGVLLIAVGASVFAVALSDVRRGVDWLVSPAGTLAVATPALAGFNEESGRI